MEPSPLAPRCDILLSEQTPSEGTSLRNLTLSGVNPKNLYAAKINPVEPARIGV
jgi:hypothetical protein